MQAVLVHLDAIVRPALRNYIAAERALDQANASNDQAANLSADFDQWAFATGRHRHAPHGKTLVLKG